MGEVEAADFGWRPPPLATPIYLSPGAKGRVKASIYQSTQWVKPLIPGQNMQATDC